MIADRPRLALALAAALCLAACRGGPEPPWEAHEPEAVGVRIVRQDLASGGERPVALSPEARRDLWARLADAQRLETPPAGAPLATRQYRIELTAGQQRWSLHVDSTDILVVDGAQHYATRRLCDWLDTQALRAAAAPAQSTADGLTALGQRLVAFVERLRTRAREGSDWGLVIATRSQTLTLPGGIQAPATPERWVAHKLGHPAATAVFALPDGVRPHPSYRTHWIRVTRAGRLTPVGVDDRDPGGDVDDPEQRQPFPAHYDLVLEQAGRGRRLYIDWRGDRVVVRVYP